LLDPLRSDTDSPAATYSVVERLDAAYRFHLYDEETLIGTVSSFQAVASGLFWYLNRTIAAAPTELLLLHASAAACDGRAVICAGRAGSGKSTLVARLAQGGFGYLTDEITALTPAHSIEPYPKPISLEPASLPLLGLTPPAGPEPIDPNASWQIPPGRLGAVADPATATAVVFPDVVRGERAALVPLSRAEAVERLAESSFPLQAGPAETLPRIRALGDQVPCFRLRFHDLDDALASVLTIMK
jgi:hypothetical protein